MFNCGFVARKVSILFFLFNYALKRTIQLEQTFNSAINSRDKYRGPTSCCAQAERVLHRARPAALRPPWLHPC